MKRLLAVILVLIILMLPAAVYGVPLEEIYNIIELYYVEEVDSGQLRNTAPEDLSTFLQDPYTSYFTPQEFTEVMQSLHGNYSGIGTVLTQTDGVTVIQSVFNGSPAEQAGLLPDDVITCVQGTNIQGASLDIVVGLIRGAADTEVVLDIRRGSQTFTVTIIRGQIELPTVEARLLGDVACISIMSFNDKTPAAFGQKLAVLRDAEPRGYIIDLRGNPGGSLSAVLKVAEELLPPGPIVYLRDRHGNELTYYTETDSKALPNLYVLVDGGSASAAEILAGALQDYGRAVLVGSTTYGKASVQTLFELSDGSGLKMTTARYYTPANQAIHGVGLTPDVQIPAGREDTYAIYNIRSTSPTVVFGIGSTAAWTKQGLLELEGAPYLESGRSYIPLRKLGEAMGAEVLWDKETRSARLVLGDVELIIPAGGDTGLLNGQTLDLTGRSSIINGITYIPARAVTEALGSRVWWDAHNHEVIIDWPQ